MGSSESEGSGSESNGGTGNEGGGTGEGSGGTTDGEVGVSGGVGSVHAHGLSLVVSREVGVNFLGILLGLEVGNGLDGGDGGSGGGEAAGIGSSDEGGLDAVGDHDEASVDDGDGGSGSGKSGSTDKLPGSVGDPRGLLGGGSDDTTFGNSLVGVADEVLGSESLNATTSNLGGSEGGLSVSGEGNLNLVSVGLGEDGGGDLGDRGGSPGVSNVSGEGDLGADAADGSGSKLGECNHDEEII